MLGRILLAIVCLCLLLPVRGEAASRTIKAGQIVGVSEDIVLSGDDVLDVQGTADKPCRLDANGQQIRTQGEWRGRINIQHSELRGFGSAKKRAVNVTASGTGDQIVIEH